MKVRAGAKAPTEAEETFDLKLDAMMYDFGMALRRTRRKCLRVGWENAWERCLWLQSRELRGVIQERSIASGFLADRLIKSQAVPRRDDWTACGRGSGSVDAVIQELLPTLWNLE